ncbi:MAG: hypothetical protein AAF847_10725 [Bacteroidota bacterium]
MKTFKLNFLLFGLLALLTFTTACNKEETVEPADVDTIVGTWEVASGDAVIAMNDGSSFDVDLNTAGTMTYKENGSGNFDFSMTLEGETEYIQGDLTWERDNKQLVITNEGTTERWDLLSDAADSKRIQFTVQTEGGEVEFTLSLVRSK